MNMAGYKNPTPSVEDENIDNENEENGSDK